MTLHTKAFTLALLLAATALRGLAADFIWCDSLHPVTYNKQTKTSTVVDVALQMLTSDLQAVTGRQQWLTAAGSKSTLQIIQADRASKKQLKQLALLGIDIPTLANSMDAFYLGVHKGQLLAVGNNGRGVAYALLELSRKAGVSPWVWWGDNTPAHKASLTLPEGFQTLQKPSIERRGLFINDEDWSLQPWSWKTFEPGNPKGTIGARTYMEVFKLLLRLRGNMVWPAMHESTVPFYLVPGAKEAADSCAIFIGTSHCEPLMRNNAGEWNVKQRGPFNYITNREAVQHYWVERLQQVAGSDNVYTIGMRGIHDGSMEGVKTLQEKTTALQQVINDQREMLGKYVSKDVAAIPQAFVPYKEVLQILENGLQVPDDVTLIWCDDNYGYLTRLSDEAQQQRSGGAGVYYHLSYWGRPHDHLWLTTIQPGLLYNEMMEAYRHQARREWIVNVHDPKAAAYQLELFLDMAWDIDMVHANTLEQHLHRWLVREFGDEAGRRLLPVMKEYYRLAGIRKPEHMGWSQIELDKKVYPKGMSPVRDTELSFKEFQAAHISEAQDYMNSYTRLAHEVCQVEQTLPQEKRDAYFSHVKYKVCATAAMAQKMLEAQRARALATAQAGGDKIEMQVAAARSVRGYRVIQQLTDHYNRVMAGGRWNHSMDYRPRGLYVFDPPTLPIGLTDQQVDQLAPAPSGLLWGCCDTKAPAAVAPMEADDLFVARNAADWQQAGQGAEVVQMLGHSMKAVRLPKGQTLTYQFETKSEGEAALRLALIPTQPNDKGGLRYRWQIDDSEAKTVSIYEPNRNEKWKQNVMRGQDLRSFPVTLGKGKHTLTITALDNHIVVDQWMVDFQPKRSFYVLPVK